MQSQSLLLSVGLCRSRAACTAGTHVVCRSLFAGLRQYLCSSCWQKQSHFSCSAHLGPCSALLRMSCSVHQHCASVKRARQCCPDACIARAECPCACQDHTDRAQRKRSPHSGRSRPPATSHRQSDAGGGWGWGWKRNCGDACGATRAMADERIEFRG